MDAPYRTQLPSFHAPYGQLYQPPPPPPPPPGVPASTPPPQVPAFPLSYSHTYALPSNHVYAVQDGVRTLFVAGLPDDAKPREIYNLFRDFPGYQSSQLKSSQAIAFVVFSNQQAAITAMHALNGLIFDLERESSLHIELAKSNSRSKRSRSDEAKSLDKKFRGSMVASVSDSGSWSSSHMPGNGNSTYNTHTSHQSLVTFGNQGVYHSGYSEEDFLTSDTFQNTTPCATLFVANLGPNCTEQELTEIFSRCSGFLKLKMQNKHGVPVAFVDFKDVACSSAALSHLQGAVLYSSHGQGMRLEYAKTRMGQKKREKA